MAHPGERWIYNTGADVLGVLIARASGIPFHRFLATRVFEPLGMVDTAFHVPSDKIHRLPVQYGTDPSTGATVIWDEPGGQWSRPPSFPGGGAGLAGTADDYLRFARLLRNHGVHEGQRIVSRQLLELMTTDQLTPEQHTTSGFGPDFFATTGFGFCVGVVTRRTDQRHVGAYGWSGGFGTQWMTDPVDDVIAILLSQRAAESPAPTALYADFTTCAAQFAA
jgi:CubicO group peptidase (beta-lactamase class C family)